MEAPSAVGDVTGAPPPPSEPAAVPQLPQLPSSRSDTARGAAEAMGIPSTRQQLEDAAMKRGKEFLGSYSVGQTGRVPKVPLRPNLKASTSSSTRL